MRIIVQIGLIDLNQKAYFDLQTSLIRYSLEQGKYVEAFQILDALLDGDLTNTTSYFTNVTGINTDCNYLLTNEPIDQSFFIPFITSADRRKQIHVGNITFNGFSHTVEKFLLNDIVRFSFKL